MARQIERGERVVFSTTEPAYLGGNGKTGIAKGITGSAYGEMWVLWDGAKDAQLVQSKFIKRARNAN